LAVALEVSILIPTYRRPQLLRRAIASALSQDAPVAMEVVVGDDADEGAAVASEFDDVRLRYQANPERLGMAGNWNRLCDVAHGDYLLLLNDDDRLLPGFVATCVSAFHRMPDLGVVFTNHFFDHRGRWEVRRCELQPGRHEDFSAKLLRYNPVPVSASLFRRTAWEHARTLPDTGSADLVLWGRIAERGWPFFYVGDPLMVYLPHAASVSGALSFRYDGVVALEALTMSDPEAERLRRERLADALVARASAHLLEGNARGATADLSRAEQLGHTSRRAWLLRALARHRTLARIAARAVRGLPRRPR
jgi:glycosyltransferase involved in cell wall biosynthesis